VLLDQVRTFARYNRWANGRLATAVAALDEEAYRADRGLFFGSIHGTLNHLLAADRLWFHRLTGEVEGDLPTTLDQILFAARAELLAARAREDARIVAFAQSLDASRLAGVFSYRNMAGATFTQPLAPVLAHVFNHQTHHRGQVHAALTGLDEPAPALDLIYFLREAA
jgi:uncharacterized damage-inducible protein DinB